MKNIWLALPFIVLITACPKNNVQTQTSTESPPPHNESVDAPILTGVVSRIPNSGGNNLYINITGSNFSKQGFKAELVPQPGTSGPTVALSTDSSLSDSAAKLFVGASTALANGLYKLVISNAYGDVSAMVTTLKGDQGAQGLQGLAGDAGAQGAQGPQGVQGPAGSNASKIVTISGGPSLFLNSSNHLYAVNYAISPALTEPEIRRIRGILMKDLTPDGYAVGKSHLAPYINTRNKIYFDNSNQYENVFVNANKSLFTNWKAKDLNPKLMVDYFVEQVRVTSTLLEITVSCLAPTSGYSGADARIHVANDTSDCAAWDKYYIEKFFSGNSTNADKPISFELDIW